jgi:hypothetical protein
MASLDIIASLVLKVFKLVRNFVTKVQKKFMEKIKL